MYVTTVMHVMRVMHVIRAMCPWPFWSIIFKITITRVMHGNHDIRVMNRAPFSHMNRMLDFMIVIYVARVVTHNSFRLLFYLLVF